MKHFLFLSAFLLTSFTLWAQEISYPEDERRMSTFELKIEGIDRVEGEIRIALFDSEKEYNKKENPLYAVVLSVDDETITWSQDSLYFGEYAIAVYHDKNENGELDSNLLGIPKEAYGFSNNARGRFGPASWKDAHFSINSERSTMAIEIK
ncbi:DUF2141 domain-containing protein [Gracilimonas sediminicola]|uniref:DUF2141 domain-containing protein n=1 Tax=Gracilimonas sediminicola TaxID=2952158 RepID=A0A9X2RHN1_9BACT|nr:DUF2141 domain-containing protein [Gracilimonas sediminicola]MCP9292498.1 DUF2141 domain-containing protein [Gracilimonas sediminicola]